MEKKKKTYIYNHLRLKMGLVLGFNVTCLKALLTYTISLLCLLSTSLACLSCLLPLPLSSPTPNMICLALSHSCCVHHPNDPIDPLLCP